MKQREMYLVRRDRYYDDRFTSVNVGIYETKAAASAFIKEHIKYLEKLSHEQEPWIMARSGLDPDERSDKTISKESISNYFINEVFQPEVEEWD